MTEADSNADILAHAGLDRRRVTGMVTNSLKGCEDGELFLESRQSESLVFDDGRLKTANFDTGQGFGLRAVSGEQTGYAHASEITEAALQRASDAVQTVRSGRNGVMADNPPSTNHSLYPNLNPIEEFGFAEKVRLLEEIDKYARDADTRVCQVTCSISAERQTIQILRNDGHQVNDIRPLVRLNVAVIMDQNGRRESGSHGVGSRLGYAEHVNTHNWRDQVDTAVRQAEINLESIPAPAGEMQVVLGPGWPGILLHEAIGHGLEGDFNRKQTSAFAKLLGERVANPGVTVVDDGTLSGRRGSLTVDDEGTPTKRTVLIEGGILKGYMQDRLNARLMGAEPTGNGRRQSFGHMPLPRMTNTYMMAGNQTAEEIITSVSKGIYAVNFGGGQVDITSGKFVFSCTEAYMLNDGKIGQPLKGATLIGNGPDVLTKVTAIGNDLSLDPGVGTCGKAGQGVPVGVGQPTLLIDGLTVGGTAT